MTKPISHSYGIRTTRVGELLHSDLCGPLPTEDIHHMLILVDDFSCFIMTRAIRDKSEAATALMEMIPAFESLTGTKVENLRTDWGGGVNSIQKN